MTRDLRQELADNAQRRSEVESEKAALEAAERNLIADAWHAGLQPGEIAALIQRSGAHVRKLRPGDVPPARLGGNAAPKKRTKRKTPPSS